MMEIKNILDILKYLKITDNDVIKQLARDKIAIPFSNGGEQLLTDEEGNIFII